jgi:glycine/D-amino acid oxidase-like deaminating enzyme
MTVAHRTSIAIIGGGIGGLTAAALLLRAGFDVQVFEQSKALSEVGAGINIGPNASRILHRLGLRKRCAIPASNRRHSTSDAGMMAASCSARHLGDSCHPMLPFMGQGGAQAIEDAATLKGCLLKFPSDIPAALRLYERLRLPRVDGDYDHPTAITRCPHMALSGHEHRSNQGDAVISGGRCVSMALDANISKPPTLKTRPPYRFRITENRIPECACVRTDMRY